jgi:hypothetical protein
MDTQGHSMRELSTDPLDPLPSVIAHLVAAKEIARFQPREPSHRLLGVIGDALDEAYRQIRLRGC